MLISVPAPSTKATVQEEERAITNIAVDDPAGHAARICACDGRGRRSTRGRRDQPHHHKHWSVDPAAWFDPAETPGSITPFLVLYALHDSMLKPMPAGPLTPSLAQRSQASEDGLTYEFGLRAGAKFHNGEPVLAG